MQVFQDGLIDFNQKNMEIWHFSYTTVDLHDASQVSGNLYNVFFLKDNDFSDTREWEKDMFLFEMPMTRQQKNK